MTKYFSELEVYRDAEDRWCIGYYPDEHSLIPINYVVFAHVDDSLYLKEEEIYKHAETICEIMNKYSW